MKNSLSIAGLLLIVGILYVVMFPVKQPSQAGVHSPVAPSPGQSSHQPASTGMSIYGSPSVSVVQINAILSFYSSPAQGKGQVLYNLGVKYGIDPAFPLAFFLNESTMGTQGEATATLALSNERCIPDRLCIDQDRGGYAKMNSWEDGFEHWYQLMVGPVYKGCGLTTIETIIPKYAPAGDNNNPGHYIYVVESAVKIWRSGKVQVAL
ncbi:hypothetical protein [Dictyobacter aurantiacus]|uniref:Mannosyl-glycoprotein endo-beta-N-acetylglucosamidase-like domain-containing protein n=1 Tax=Dictyobacter aurantiacus TaxID=1936993 RepID=A0A401ZH84_9CHLR|nr:hypothetical protein [Dictyobacter aurantiacus]GCE06153.1 hypothetical protein KDAU_34820 [Dictyobacter aurantiacus]